jgi:hypothetical protein
MASRSPSLEPTVIIVHSDPEYVVYLDEIVMTALDVCGTCFIDSRLALEWFTTHPARADLVIAKEGMPQLSGFKLLKALDAVLLRPVYSIFLLEPTMNDAHAQEWFYGLDKVFSMVRPLRAVRYPYLMHNFAMALHEAFPWRVAQKPEQKNHIQDSGSRNNQG